MLIKTWKNQGPVSQHFAYCSWHLIEKTDSRKDFNSRRNSITDTGTAGCNLLHTSSGLGTLVTTFVNKKLQTLTKADDYLPAAVTPLRPEFTPVLSVAGFPSSAAADPAPLTDMSTSAAKRTQFNNSHSTSNITTQPFGVQQVWVNRSYHTFRVGLILVNYKHLRFLFR